MKKNLLAVAFSFAAISTFAQIPNYSFENWTNLGSYEIPNNWATMNNTTATYSVFTATKGTPGNPGNSYLKLTSATAGSGVVNAIAVSGKLDTINMTPISGFPCTLQPVSFSGSWQHMIYGTSQGSVKAVLTKWNSGLNRRDTVAVAAQKLTGMAMSWANFNISFVYSSVTVPDSCIIELKASGATPTNNDYLWVDNLAFVGTVTGLNQQDVLVNNLAVYPNPAKNNLTVDFNSVSMLPALIEVTDINGKTVLSKNAGMVGGHAQHTLDVSVLPKGTYFVNLICGNQREVKKVTIE